MSVRALDVVLSQRPIGTLSNLPGDFNLFVFSEDYLDDPTPPVLSQSLLNENAAPMRRVPRTHTVAPAFFANLLPERDSLLRAMVAWQYRIAQGCDFPFLVALGMDLPGAVVLRSSAADGDEASIEPGAPKDVPDKAPGDEPRIRFSLAGVQLKFSASVASGRLTVPMNGVGGMRVVKLPTNTYPRLPENEFAMMTFAAAVGLRVPAIELVELEEIAGLPRDLPLLRPDEPPLAYTIERFDRRPDGSRVHVEDFNQIAGQKPDEKYERKTTAWIAAVATALCADGDLDELVRRIVFGIGIGNNDMHLKNWAVRYPDGRHAELAPMYDFVCTRRYLPSGELALTIGGERRFDRIGREAIARFARQAELSERQVARVADDMIARMRDTWPHFKERVPDRMVVAAVDETFAMPLMSGR